MNFTGWSYRRCSHAHPWDIFDEAFEAPLGENAVVPSEGAGDSDSSADSTSSSPSDSEGGESDAGN